jgi:hypothetical protein
VVHFNGGALKARNAGSSIMSGKCRTGAGQTTRPPGCGELQFAGSDGDNDGDADQEDFGFLQTCLGSDRFAADPPCR